MFYLPASTTTKMRFVLKQPEALVYGPKNVYVLEHNVADG